MNYTRCLFAIFFGTLTAGCSQMAKIDETYTSKDATFQRSFAKPKAACLKAGAEALKEMGAGIDSQSSDKLISDRYGIFEGATAYGNGATAVAQKISETGKIYIAVSTDGSGCKVLITRVRAWINNEEYPKVSVDFVKSKMVTPFFNELAERLARL